VEGSDRREASEDIGQNPNDRDERERAVDTPENVPVADDLTTEELSASEVFTDGTESEEVGAGDVESDRADVEDVESNETGVEADPDGFQERLEAKDRHVRELYDELVAARLAVDEAVAKAEAGELRVRDLEEEREQLKEGEREWHRWRERQAHQMARLEREIEHREAEIEGLEDLLERNKSEMEVYAQEAQDTISRKDAALEDALRRVEGLERDLEERENEAVELRTTIDQLRAELDLEYELRRRMADPENRLREGIELFNDSEHLQTIRSISKSLGPPEIRAVLGEGEESPVILTFIWDEISWRTYHANPGLAVEEPRVYLQGIGDDLSGMASKPSNAHVGPDGRVVLGL
jgi:ribonuclease Y